jgi:hypothetical protein
MERDLILEIQEEAKNTSCSGYEETSSADLLLERVRTDQGIGESVTEFKVVAAIAQRRRDIFLQDLAKVDLTTEVTQNFAGWDKDGNQLYEPVDADSTWQIVHYLCEGSAEAPQCTSSESECATTLIGAIDARGQKSQDCEQEFRRRRNTNVRPRRRENTSDDKGRISTFEHTQCEGLSLCRSATLPLYEGLSRAPRHNVNLLGSGCETAV